MTTFNSSATLKGTGPAADLVRAYLLGVESSTGKVKDIVNNVEKTIALSGGMTRGPDLHGDALICATETTDFATITEDLDPAGTALSSVLVFKPSTLTIGDWRALFGMYNGTGPLLHMGKYNGTTDLYWSTESALIAFTGAVSNLAADTLCTIVTTWDGSTVTLFMTGVGSASLTWLAGTHPQTAGAATALRIAGNAAGDGGFRGRYYFFGYSDTAWSSTDAQAVADDPLATLFNSAGGGGSNFCRIVGNRFSLAGPGGLVG